MKNNEFCFILCVNNYTLLNECVEYIKRLYVPEGYSIDLLTVEEARAMTFGYNEAMNASNAKYKIYMHQDVFIINRHFLEDILNIFKNDEKIGLIGMVGYKDISPDGVMWHADKCGTDKLYGRGFYNHTALDDYRYSPADGITDVCIADGMLLATSADITWDETFDGWDFYDASQCMRFKNNGYRIVVPNQKIPWVIHDDGYFLKLWNYEKNKELFLNKYIYKD